MTPAVQRERAEAFHALHRQGRILVLANAWDAASARIFEVAGFPAVGTTSAGVAWSLGHPDGQQISPADLIQATQRICRAVAVPVTVDVERGFGSTSAEIAEIVGALLAAGAVGINIEDGPGEVAGALAPAGALAEKIAAVRAGAVKAGVPLFINARTDAYLLPTADPAARFADAARRLNAYADAGADGVFAPGVADLDEIARLARAVPRPLNVYAFHGVPSVPQLAEAGVRRVSVGCGPMQAVLGLTRRIAAELLSAGTYAAMTENALSVRELNAMFAARRDPDVAAAQRAR